MARLAGLPFSVVERAKDVLARLERYELAVFAEEKKNGFGAPAASRAVAQVSLFAVANENAIDALREVDVDKLSPEAALKVLGDLKNKIV